MQVSSETTENLGLHTWEPTDYVKMDEFNDNFEKIDQNAGEVAQQLANVINDLLQKAINVKMPLHGLTPAVGDGVADDSTVLDAIHAYAKANKIDVYYPTGTYMRSTGMIWDGSSYSVYGSGNATINFQNQTSGYSVNVIGQQTVDSDAYKNPIHEIAGIYFKGPDTDATTVDCFYFNDAYNASMLTLRKINVYGFRDQFVYGSNNWAIKFIGVSGEHSHRYINHYFSSNNSGENYNYYGCDFYSSFNASGTASALYSEAPANLDCNFFGCSFDYNDNEGIFHDGAFTFHGCHFEDRSTNPMFSLIASSSNIPSLSIYGGKIIPSETIPGRDCLITTQGSTDIGVIVEPTMVNGYNHTLQIIKALDGYIPKISFRAGLFSIGGVNGSPYTYPSNMTNRLYNGDFETGDLSGWTSNIGTYTYTVQTSTVHFGTNALSISTSGASGTGTLAQKFNCQPGQRVLIRGWMNITQFTAGSIYLRLIGTNQAGSQITIPTIQNPTSVTNEWVGCGGKFVVPKGVTNIEFQIYVSGFQGQAYFDDLVLDLI